MRTWNSPCRDRQGTAVFIRRMLGAMAGFCLAAVLAAGCASTEPEPGRTPPTDSAAGEPAESAASQPADSAAGAAAFALDRAQPAMGKSRGVYYEIFVRSFHDSDGDGIGDLRGVIERLDYLQDLGIKGIWLMPIHPSPSYHGYDVTDYYEVNPEYGTLDDFRALTEAAHERGIEVIIDLVVNHSSSEHPWFKSAFGDKNSPYREWYTFADGTRPEESQLGAWGQQAWHGTGANQYVGIFWEGMPDLNLDHPAVRAEMIKIGQFWLKQGADGFRLDAAKHIYEDFQSSVNNPDVVKKNQAWWQEFRRGLNEVNPDAYLIGEIWDSASVVGPYLNHALDSGFNFDLAKMLVNAAKLERASTIPSVLSKTYSFFSKQSDGAFVDAPFLTNHDQNRVMSELDGHGERAKMAASLLLTMPGTPYIYYGEEIGMRGVKPDEQIREPMLWSSDSKAAGQTRWQPPKHADGVVPVEVQLKDPSSLLRHYQTMIAWRNEEPLLADGAILPYAGVPNEVLAFIRLNENDQVLVLHNLSAREQTVDLGARPDLPFGEMVRSTKEEAALRDGVVTLPPYSSVLLK
nr:alpha-amylase family glycosyl hydrolase [Paenibacillus thiaminolyticus]